jgi:hypothetical protein
MDQMKTRRLIVFALLGILACCGAVFGAVFAVLHSPSLLHRAASAFGYEVSAQTVSISPNLSGSISRLGIKSLRNDGLMLVASNVTAKNSLDMALRGEIESFVLQRNVSAARGWSSHSSRRLGVTGPIQRPFLSNP